MDKIWNELYNAAIAVHGDRHVSDYIDAGCVASAIQSKSGKIYTGVCVDTCGSLGVCAERNAVFNMLTNGENEILRVLTVMPDGKAGVPCGACRELFVQLMPQSYRNIELMLDFEQGKTVTLDKLTPDWWI